MCVKSLEELTEVRLRVVRARRCLRVILDGKDGGFPVPETFYRSVVEVTVGDFERFRTRDFCAVTADREAVVLGRYKYLSCSEIPHWVVAPAVPVWQLDCVAAERKPQQLVAEADAEDRQAAVGE